MEASGHLQATGRDGRARKQYRYHSAWREYREAKKFEQLSEFAARLPRLRSAVAQDLGRDDLSREYVTAAAVRLLETSCIRVGNEVYRRENGTYGLTTLRRRHVDLDGSALHFQFRAKGGRTRSVQVNEPEVASVIRKCHELPGKSLLVWRDAEGHCREIGSEDVNRYLRERTGLDITAKVFRLWMGSVHALDHLLDQPPAQSDAEAKRQFLAAVDTARDALGNTRAVCRASYLHPNIEALHMAGELEDAARFSTARSSKWLDREEIALKRVLAARRLAVEEVELLQEPVN